jgi:AraC family transcriptional regulator
MVAELLLEASATFETDRRRAKLCIEQAAELLQAEQNRREPRQGEFPLVRGGLATWQARRVAEHVESNIGSKIHVTDLAALARLSIGHFFRAFRLTFGASPQAYLMQQRILRAQVIMAGSNKPLAQIALDCGLSDQAHFSRTFRRFTGVTPTDWRRQVSAGLRSARAV